MVAMMKRPATPTCPIRWDVISCLCYWISAPVTHKSAHGYHTHSPLPLRHASTPLQDDALSGLCHTSQAAGHDVPSSHPASPWKHGSSENDSPASSHKAGWPVDVASSLQRMRLKAQQLQRRAEQGPCTPLPGISTHGSAFTYQL